MPYQLTVQRNLNFFNVKDYRAQGDNATDNTTMIANAYAAAKAAGGGALFFPAGTYISGNIPLLNNDKVFFLGAGIGISILKLKNGANTDLISAYTANINLSTSFGTGSSTGITTPWGISNMTLDGNQANQTGGPSYPLRYYGYGEIFQNVEVKNGYSGNILRDWSATTPNAFVGSWENVQISFANGPGLVVGGPTDLKFNKVLPNNSFGNNWQIGPNAGGLNAVNCHSWAPNNGAGRVTSLLVEANQCVFDNCEFEGSDFAQAVILGNETTFKGYVFAGTRTGAGIKIGQQAGETPVLGQLFQSAGVTVQEFISGCNIDAVITDITNANGSLWLDADAGNSIQVAVTQSSSVYLTGSPSGNTTLLLQGNGLTADGSIGKGSSQRFFSSAFQGYTVGRSSDGKIWAAADTFDGVWDFANGCNLQGYSDNFSTVQWSINGGNGNIATNGNVAVGQSATTPDPGAGGTITTANVGIARVTPAASRAGVILQAGTIVGQKCTVVNNSASFTITFAISGTSHVAQGVSLVIAALGKYDFTWDSVAALWY